MTIGVPDISERDDCTIYQVRVQSGGGNRNLWLGVPSRFGAMLSDSCDAPLAALLMPAMAAGEDIRVAGAISEQLLYSFSGRYQTLLRQVMPALRPITIHAAHRISHQERDAGVATGFSGGVDSFSALFDHWFRPVPRRFRLTHLLYHNVGSHSGGGEALFRERYARLAPTAARLGLPFISVNSNLGDFYPPGLGFQQTHTPRNAAAALVLQRGLSRYYYASTYAYRDVFVGPSYDMAYSDPVAVPMLSTEAMQAVSVGGEHRRVEKILEVADIPESWNVLDVCVWAREAGNCSRCWKCLRTLLTLEIGGVLDRYAGVFDLDQYRRVRPRYMGEVLRSRNPLLREIVDLARERRFEFPLAGRLFSCVPLATMRTYRDRLRQARRRHPDVSTEA